jgi:hypothetical protein
MAATWVIDDIQFVDRATREIIVTATRTEGAISISYRLNSFIIRTGETLGNEGDRLAADLKALANADKAWNTPDLSTVFPNAATVLAGKLDALEM